MTNPQIKGNDISIMIWGAIWLGGKSNLVILERDLESEREGYSSRSYIKLLDDQMERIWSPSMSIMQDNAANHTARVVTAWFEEHVIPLCEWPPYSPELNPIEHVWAILKQRLADNHSHLLDLDQGHEALNAFANAMVKEWEAIDKEEIDNIIRSMCTSVNAVIEAQG